MPPNNRKVTVNGKTTFFSGAFTDAEKIAQKVAETNVGNEFTSFDNAGLSQSQIDSIKSVQDAFKADKATQDAANALDRDRETPQSDSGITSTEGDSRAPQVPSVRPPADTVAVVDNIIADLEARRAAATETINKQFDVAKTDTEGAQKGETGTTSAGLARLGGFLGGSGSGTGVMLNLAGTHRREILALESKRASAIQAANDAINDKQFAAAQLKINEIKGMDETINERNQDFFDNVLKLSAEERAALSGEAERSNKVQDNARSALQIMLDKFSSFKYDDLSPETQAALDKMAQDAGIPAEAVRATFSKSKVSRDIDKAVEGKIVDLYTAAAAGGATQETLNAIADAEDLSTAQALASPFISKSGGGKIFTSGKLKYTDSDKRDFEEAMETDAQFLERGSVSPDAYVAGLAEWVRAGGLRVDYLKEFDPEFWLGPEAATDPAVPEFIQKEFEQNKTTVITYGPSS